MSRPRFGFPHRRGKYSWCLPLGECAPKNSYKRDDRTHGQIKFTFGNGVAFDRCTASSGVDVTHNAVQHRVLRLGDLDARPEEDSGGEFGFAAAWREAEGGLKKI